MSPYIRMQCNLDVCWCDCTILHFPYSWCENQRPICQRFQDFFHLDSKTLPSLLVSLNKQWLSSWTMNVYLCVRYAFMVISKNPFCHYIWSCSQLLHKSFPECFTIDLSFNLVPGENVSRFMAWKPPFQNPKSCIYPCMLIDYDNIIMSTFSLNKP